MGDVRYINNVDKDDVEQLNDVLNDVVERFLDDLPFYLDNISGDIFVEGEITVRCNLYDRPVSFTIPIKRRCEVYAYGET